MSYNEFVLALIQWKNPPAKHARLFVKFVFFSDFSYHKMFYEFLSCAAKIDFITFIRTHQKDKILIKT